MIYGYVNFFPPLTAKKLHFEVLLDVHPSQYVLHSQNLTQLYNMYIYIYIWDISRFYMNDSLLALRDDFHYIHCNDLKLEL